MPANGRWDLIQRLRVNVHCIAVSSSLEVVTNIIQSIQMPVTFILSLLK
jgi:hypothetical protein